MSEAQWAQQMMAHAKDMSGKEKDYYLGMHSSMRESHLLRDKIKQLENENRMMKKSLSEWIEWENKQIEYHGEYHGIAISKLIDQARECLKKLEGANE